VCAPAITAVIVALGIAAPERRSEGHIGPPLLPKALQSTAFGFRASSNDQLDPCCGRY